MIVGGGGLLNQIQQIEIFLEVQFPNVRVWVTYRRFGLVL